MKINIPGTFNPGVVCRVIYENTRRELIYENARYIKPGSQGQAL